jgi:hypothetical protein
MYPRPRPCRAFAGLFSVLLAWSACEGEGPSAATDGSVERHTGIDGPGSDGATGSGRRDGGFLIDGGHSPGPPPAVPNPAAIRILPAQTDLLGSFLDACSSGPGTERWCAFSRLETLATRSLWLVNVSRVAAGKPAAPLATCGVPGLCLVLSSNLHTARPDVGPVYPEDVARAEGNTFIYYTDPRSAPSDPFEGDIWAYTIGSASTTRIGPGVFDCAVSGQRFIESGKRQIDKVVGICAGNPSSLPGEPASYFTLRGGVVAGQTVAPEQPPPLPPTELTTSPLPEVQRVYPIHPATNVLRYRVGFTADGETLALSSGGALESEVEKLVTYRSDDLGKGGTALPVLGGDNITRWTLAPDGKRIFYFRDYNYNGMGTSSGTLMMADFPSGANARPLRGSLVPGGNTGGVGAYRLLVDNQEQEKGVGILTNLTMGRGDYSIIKNTAGSFDDPANVLPIVQGARSLPVPSPDLRFSVFARERSAGAGGSTSDLWVVKNDGSNTPCQLTSGTGGVVFGPSFTRSAGLVLWADNYDPGRQSAQGLYTDPADCANPAKRNTFARELDYWFIDGDRLLLYSDESDGAKVSIKYAAITGNTVGPPVTIQSDADRSYDLVLDSQPSDGTPPRFKAVIYTLTNGNPATDGVYYYELPAP